VLITTCASARIKMPRKRAYGTTCWTRKARLQVALFLFTSMPYARVPYRNRGILKTPAFR